MPVGFTLSHRLARGFWIVGSAAALAACAGESPTKPGDSNPVSSVTVSPGTAELDVSATLQLAAELRDSLGTTLSGRSVSWSSDIEAIATVSVYGVVRGADTGTATITAFSEGRSASATVKVKRNAHAGYYVSPSGSSGGDGSRARPWDLPTALANASGRVQPGDTVWLRGGTYRGSFRSSLAGTSSRPVVVRQYPGERAIIDGGGTSATTLRVGGQYSVFWGFEMINSDPTRVFSIGGGDLRSNVIANYASNTKYINLTIRDGGVAIYNEATYGNVEIVGCIIYNIGWEGSDRGHGHALYLKSNTGPVTARDNIMFNQFSYGVHVYSNAGSGAMNNIRIEGNISFNNGTQSTNSTASNILFGGEDYSTGGVLKNNYTYDSPGVGGRNVRVGYGSTRNGTMYLLDNYFVGGATVLDVGYWSSLTATNNQLMGTATVVNLNDPALTMSRFTGQTQVGLPTTTKVVVRPNAYEPGRANVVVYNWGQDGSVSLDLSGMVPAGATYEIRNVQDFFGSPVTTGTYGGGSVTLPIRGVQPPLPIGMSSARSPSTGTVFNAYVVTIRP